jgi:hypothetical protein
MWEEVPIWLAVKDRRKGGRSVFLERFRLSRAVTWSYAVPPMITSAVDEQRLCPTQRALSSTFSNRGYEGSVSVTTLYRVHQLLSVWLRSGRFSVPEETHQKRPGMEGATDSSTGHYWALLWRAEMPEGACPQLHRTTNRAFLSWVRTGWTQTNAGITMWPWRRNGEQGKWEPIATCSNVHQAKHVRLHGLDSSAEKGIVRRLQGKMPLENVGLVEDSSS